MQYLLITIAAVVAGSGNGEPDDYKTAYAKAQAGDKPMLVLVTADWCAPCQTMKATTIPKLKSTDAFKNFHYTTVDLGREEELARKLIGKRGVPQLIMFEKQDNRWKRRYLRGIQTPETVQAFMNQSRTAKRPLAPGSVGK